MTNRDIYKVGTLIKDREDIAVIYRIIEVGELSVDIPILNWNLNYEIYYFNGNITIMSHGSLSRLINKGVMKILGQMEQDELISEK